MTDYTTIKHIIQTRRTTKPHLMNGKQIPDEQVMDLLSLANWAPTHGLTQPWRFKVYAGEKVKAFCFQHVELFRQNIPAEKFTQEKYDKIRHMGDFASHLVIAVMERGTLPNIPVLEEIAAASCAIQNLLLGATAQGIASYWGSGGMAYHSAMKVLLQLKEEDLVLGILYLGYSDYKMNSRRPLPIEAKVEWVN
ncbi:nitroreductase family protein [Adhaeribacter aquaticus]|uniref:nitroreductase family protein n=1 Tax=Adhaeribacter aquaticus TaxID=299567 RepID=UPI00041819C3|nr:nitroreductase [Adhaeribacter aquaticus]